MHTIIDVIVSHLQGLGNNYGWHRYGRTILWPDNLLIQDELKLGVINSYIISTSVLWPNNHLCDLIIRFKFSFQ